MDKVETNLLKFRTDFCGRLKNFKNRLQDVTLLAGLVGTTIQTHRIVISIASNYFETMFASGMKEARQETIEINGISGTILKKMIHFCYTGEIEIDEKNVQSLAKASLLLQFDTIADRCGEHMVKKMNVENCCSIAVFAEQHNFKKLLELPTDFLSENFEKFTGTILFDFCKKHKCDHIFALAKVLQEKRQDKQEDKLVSRKSRKQLKDEKSLGHLAAISWPNILEYYSLKENQWKSLPCLKEFNLNDNYKVIGVGFNNSSFIFTCTSSKSTVVKTHNLFGGADRSNVILLESLWGAKSVVENNAVFITGGSKTGISTATVNKYNLVTQEWSQLPDMLRRRNSHSAAVLENHMYVMGGFDNYSSTQLMYYCEKYDFVQKRWQECNSMIYGRSECVTTVLNGYIYVTGGTNNRGTYQEHIERFDPKTNKWTIVSAVTPLCRCFSIYGFENHLYLGGFGVKNKTLMVRYNPECNLWEDMPESKNVMRYFQLIKCNLPIQSESLELTVVD